MAQNDDPYPKILECHGSLAWNYKLGEWVATAPGGGVDEAGNPRVLHAFHLDPGVAVEIMHRDWIDAGRPSWPAQQQLGQLRPR